MSLPLEAKLTKQAKKFLDGCDRKKKLAIIEHIRQLTYEPVAYPLSKPLRSRMERCCRVGDFRILFTVEETVLLVAQIDHRKEVYD